MPAMRVPAILALALCAAPAHADEAKEFIASLGAPGLSAPVEEFVRGHRARTNCRSSRMPKG
jgi:hypothetical protein